MASSLIEALYRIPRQANLTELTLRVLDGKEAVIICEYDSLTAPIIAQGCRDEKIPASSVGLRLIENWDREDLEMALRYILANVPHVFIAGFRHTRENLDPLVRVIEEASGKPIIPVRSHADVCYALHPERYREPPR